MNTVQTILVLAVATMGSISLALLVQWLTLRALFMALPGRRKLTVAQAALISHAPRSGGRPRNGFTRCESPVTRRGRQPLALDPSRLLKKLATG